MKRPYHIFLVDDDDDDRLLITTAVYEYSDLFELSFAVDGLQALNILASTKRLPDLIMLDLNMPKVGGMEVLRKLKESERFQHIPVIMLTTSSYRGDIDAAYKLGVNSYIVKPTSNAKLIEFAELITRYWFQLVKIPSVV